VTGERPTGMTAIGIVSPPDVCGYADHYRSLYMPDEMHNIEPHITLTVPFVPYDKLSEAEPKLRQALAHCPPQHLTFRGFETFPEEGVLYLSLAHHERVHAIYSAILAEFPEYPAYEGKFGDDFIPHMTVGVLSDPEELKRIHEELSVQNLYIGFDVEHVTVKYECEDGVWGTWAEIPLGGEG
jgi:2'-5' RNA ligase